MRSDYSKFAEFMDLIKDLCTNDKTKAHITYADIQKRFHCSRRTAERIIMRIKSQYKKEFGEIRDPDDYKTKYFYIYQPNWLYLRPVEEFDMLALAAAKTRIKNKMLSHGLQELEKKIWYKNQKNALETAKELENMGSDSIYIDSVAGPEAEIIVDKSMTTKLMKAISNRKKISFQYMGATERYTVCPLGILCGTINNYLVAARNMNIEHYKPYTYALNKIQDIQIEKEVFQRRDFNLRIYSDKSFGVFHSPKGPYDIEWLVTKEAVPEAKRYTFHKTQQFHDNPDGSMTITMRADGLREIAEFLFKWRGGIIPIKPAELIQEYQTMIDLAQRSLNKIKK